MLLFEFVAGSICFGMFFSSSKPHPNSKFQFDLENVSNYFGPLAFQFLGLSCLKTNVLYIKRMTVKIVPETDKPVALTNWKVFYLPYFKKRILTG